MYDTKEEVQRAYEIMKEGSKTIYQLEATPYSSCRVVFDSESIQAKLDEAVCAIND